MPDRAQCELCSDQAAVYCHADAACLCWSCNTQVHSVNFLVKRHVRTFLCSICYAPTPEIATTSTATACISSFCLECSSQKEGYCSHEELPLSSEAPRFSQDSENDAAFLFTTPKQTKASIEVPFSAVTIPSEPLKQDVSVTASEISCSGSSVCKRSRKENTKQDIRKNIGFQYHEMSEMDSDATSSSQSCDRKRKRTETGNFNQIITDSSCKEMKIVLEGAVRKQTQLEPAAEAKLEAILSKWHSDLGLVESGIVHIAMHLLRRLLQVVGSGSTRSKITRVSLAVCLSLAIKLCEQKAHIPAPKQMVRCTGVSQKLLQMCEAQLCNLLGWNKMHEEWAESSP